MKLEPAHLSKAGVNILGQTASVATASSPDMRVGLPAIHARHRAALHRIGILLPIHDLASLDDLANQRPDRYRRASLQAGVPIRLPLW